MKYQRALAELTRSRGKRVSRLRHWAIVVVIALLAFITVGIGGSLV